MYQGWFSLSLPSGPYFKTCISQTDLDELNIEIIRNALYKVCWPPSLSPSLSSTRVSSVYIVNFSGQAYLEDFYKFCQEIGGTTAEVMGEILQVKPLP